MAPSPVSSFSLAPLEVSYSDLVEEPVVLAAARSFSCGRTV